MNVSKMMMILVLPMLLFITAFGAVYNASNVAYGDLDSDGFYDLYNCNDLQGIIEDSVVNRSFEFNQTIDCSNFDYGDGFGFMPIQLSNNQTNGLVLNGNGLSITGLVIDRTHETFSIGIFRGINNTILANFTVASPNVSGQEMVGTVAGVAINSQLDNVEVSGALVDANLSFVGGIVGRSSGTVYNNVNFTGPSSDISSLEGDSIGGIVGESYNDTLVNVFVNSTLRGLHNTSSIYIGGIVGDSFSEIYGALAVVNISGYKHLGGIVGAGTYNNISTAQSYGHIGGNSDLGGMIGLSEGQNYVFNTSSYIVFNGLGVIGGSVGLVKGNQTTLLSNLFNGSITATSFNYFSSTIGHSTANDLKVGVFTSNETGNDTIVIIFNSTTPSVFTENLCDYTLDYLNGTILGNASVNITNYINTYHYLIDYDASAADFDFEFYCYEQFLLNTSMPSSDYAIAFGQQLSKAEITVAPFNLSIYSANVSVNSTLLNITIYDNTAFTNLSFNKEQNFSLFNVTNPYTITVNTSSFVGNVDTVFYNESVHANYSLSYSLEEPLNSSLFGTFSDINLSDLNLTNLHVLVGKYNGTDNYSITLLGDSFDVCDYEFNAASNVTNMSGGIPNSYINGLNFTVAYNQTFSTLYVSCNTAVNVSTDNGTLAMQYYASYVFTNYSALTLPMVVVNSTFNFTIYNSYFENVTINGTYYLLNGSITTLSLDDSLFNVSFPIELYNQTDLSAEPFEKYMLEGTIDGSVLVNDSDFNISSLAPINLTITLDLINGSNNYSISLEGDSLNSCTYIFNSGNGTTNVSGSIPTSYINNVSNFTVDYAFGASNFTDLSVKCNSFGSYSTQNFNLSHGKEYIFSNYTIIPATIPVVAPSLYNLTIENNGYYNLSIGLTNYTLTSGVNVITLNTSNVSHIIDIELANITLGVDYLQDTFAEAMINSTELENYSLLNFTGYVPVNFSSKLELVNGTDNFSISLAGDGNFNSCLYEFNPGLGTNLSGVIPTSYVNNASNFTVEYTYGVGNFTQFEVECNRNVELTGTINYSFVFGSEMIYTNYTIIPATIPVVAPSLYNLTIVNTIYENLSIDGVNSSLVVGNNIVILNSSNVSYIMHVELYNYSMYNASVVQDSFIEGFLNSSDVENLSVLNISSGVSVHPNLTANINLVNGTDNFSINLAGESFDYCYYHFNENTGLNESGSIPLSYVNNVTNFTVQYGYGVGNFSDVSVSCERSILIDGFNYAIGKHLIYSNYTVLPDAVVAGPAVYNLTIVSAGYNNVTIDGVNYSLVQGSNTLVLNSSNVSYYVDIELINVSTDVDYIQENYLFGLLNNTDLETEGVLNTTLIGLANLSAKLNLVNGTDNFSISLQGDSNYDSCSYIFNENLGTNLSGVVATSYVNNATNLTVEYTYGVGNFTDFNIECSRNVTVNNFTMSLGSEMIFTNYSIIPAVAMNVSNATVNVTPYNLTVVNIIFENLSIDNVNTTLTAGNNILLINSSNISFMMDVEFYNKTEYIDRIEIVSLSGLINSSDLENISVLNTSNVSQPTLNVSVYLTNGSTNYSLILAGDSYTSCSYTFNENLPSNATGAIPVGYINNATANFTVSLAGNFTDLEVGCQRTEILPGPFGMTLAYDVLFTNYTTIPASVPVVTPTTYNLTVVNNGYYNFSIEGFNFTLASGITVIELNTSNVSLMLDIELLNETTTMTYVQESFAQGMVNSSELENVSLLNFTGVAPTNLSVSLYLVNGSNNFSVVLAGDSNYDSCSYVFNEVLPSNSSGVIPTSYVNNASANFTVVFTASNFSDFEVDCTRNATINDNFTFVFGNEIIFTNYTIIPAPIVNTTSSLFNLTIVSSYFENVTFDSTNFDISSGTNVVTLNDSHYSGLVDVEIFNQTLGASSVVTYTVFDEIASSTLENLSSINVSGLSEQNLSVGVGLFNTTFNYSMDLAGESFTACDYVFNENLNTSMNGSIPVSYINNVSNFTVIFNETFVDLEVKCTNNVTVPVASGNISMLHGVKHYFTTYSTLYYNTSNATIDTLNSLNSAINLSTKASLFPLVSDKVVANLKLSTDNFNSSNIDMSWTSLNTTVARISGDTLFVNRTGVDKNFTLVLDLTKNNLSANTTFDFTLAAIEVLNVSNTTGLVFNITLEKVVIDENFTGDELVFDNTTFVNISIINISKPQNETVFLNLFDKVVNNTVNLSDNNLTVVRETVSIEFPQGTEIVGNNWSGELILPTQRNVTNRTAPNVSNRVTNITKVIKVGSDYTVLNLSKAVRLQLIGETGKFAAYAQGGSDFTKITTQCNSATNSSNIVGFGDCYYDDGTDLIIWTKHFTEFASYTETTVSSGSSGGGSSGGGGGSSRSRTAEVTSPSSSVLDEFVIEIGGETDLDSEYTGDQKVEITSKDDSSFKVEFTHDFQDELDLSDLSFTKGTTADGRVYAVVSGIDLQDDFKKTITVPTTNSVESVCIKDQEITSALSISSDCNGANEYIVACDDTWTNRGYKCDSTSSYFKVYGLQHSGVIEFEGEFSVEEESSEDTTSQEDTTTTDTESAPQEEAEDEPTTVVEKVAEVTKIIDNEVKEKLGENSWYYILAGAVVVIIFIGVFAMITKK